MVSSGVLAAEDPLRAASARNQVRQYHAVFNVPSTRSSAIAENRRDNTAPSLREMGNLHATSAVKRHIPTFTCLETQYQSVTDRYRDGDALVSNLVAQRDKNQ